MVVSSTTPLLDVESGLPPAYEQHHPRAKSNSFVPTRLDILSKPRTWVASGPAREREGMEVEQGAAAGEFSGVVVEGAGEVDASGRKESVQQHIGESTSARCTRLGPFATEPLPSSATFDSLPASNPRTRRVSSHSRTRSSGLNPLLPQPTGRKESALEISMWKYRAKQEIGSGLGLGLKGRTTGGRGLEWDEAGNRWVVDRGASEGESTFLEKGMGSYKYYLQGPNGLYALIKEVESSLIRDENAARSLVSVHCPWVRIEDQSQVSVQCNNTRSIPSRDSESIGPLEKPQKKTMRPHTIVMLISLPLREQARLHKEQMGLERHAACEGLFLVLLSALICGIFLVVLCRSPRML